MRTISATTCRPLSAISPLKGINLTSNSLLAGKLVALLQRPYTKGRDLYDLAWYLNHPTWPDPNLTLLNNGLAQSDWQGPSLSSTTWCKPVQNRLSMMDWDRVVADVTPFIMDESLAIMDRELMQQHLERRCAD
jgi:hypothetical protein